jgi:DNA topoisomerase-1
MTLLPSEEKEREDIMEKYTLIVTEKPDAAQRIAQALDAIGKPEKTVDRGVPYYIANRDKKLVVVPAIGHLYTVIQERGRGNCYPAFNVKWGPRYIAERGAKQTKTWIDVISKLAENADSYIDACDYDIEGAIIGYTLLKSACGNKDRVAARMKYSTLTESELQKSYAERIPHLDLGMIEAGKTRHEMDWLYGINISRALTAAVNSWSGRYETLSTGRVQGPTLKFLVTRERIINTFVPTPYWSIKAQVEVNGAKHPAEYQKKIIETKVEADGVVDACKGRTGIIEGIEEKTTPIMPPIPFDLGLLQSEAYNSFGYTPRKTSQISERLYLDALISYPRTSSQKLPPVIDYWAILSGLSQEATYKHLSSKLLDAAELRPREGSKQDPAHPAIYPTGKKPQRTLDEAERRVWDLIVRRFMAAFGKTAIIQSVKAVIHINGHYFFLRGRRILKEGWMKFYKPYLRTEEVPLPPTNEGEHVKLRQIIREDKFTKPPPRYNPSSLLKRMETEGIGTKATRADIIQTLYNRKYITGEPIVVTDLGLDVTEALREYAAPVISVELTRDLEDKMDKIQNKNEKRQTILLEAVEHLKPVLRELKQQEMAIGEALSNSLKQTRVQELVIGPCPTCHTGRLMIMFSRRTKKRFIGCTNYFNGTCKTSFPLPQTGTVKPTGSNCKNCGWPLLIVRARPRHPWSLCFNQKCPGRNLRRKGFEMQHLQSRSPNETTN